MSAETDGDRSAALATIADLARRHGLTVTEIAAALGAAAPAGVTAPPRRNRARPISTLLEPEYRPQANTPLR